MFLAFTITITSLVFQCELESFDTSDVSTITTTFLAFVPSCLLLQIIHAVIYLWVSVIRDESRVVFIIFYYQI